MADDTVDAVRKAIERRLRTGLGRPYAPAMGAASLVFVVIELDEV